MFDVICIGNALIDSFLDISEKNHLIHLDNKSSELRIKLGEKIPLEKAKFELGGNACNVAVGLSRLGFRVELIAEVGDDAFSSRIKNSLIEEKVDLSRFKVSHAPASFAVSINYKDDRTLFVHHVERSHEFNLEVLQAKWLYLSSMGEKWRHVYRKAAAAVKEQNIKLAFNPGTRQIAAGSDVFEPVLAVTDLLFLNKEEAMRVVFGEERILTGNNSRQIKLLCEKLKAKGPKIVVVTDGSKGAYAMGYENEYYHIKNVDSPIVERTGAGDAFSTGFLAAILQGHDIPDALLWGALNASSVVGKIGAQPGLLTKEQMERKLKSHQQ